MPPESQRQRSGSSSSDELFDAAEHIDEEHIDEHSGIANLLQQFADDDPDFVPEDHDLEGEDDEDLEEFLDVNVDEDDLEGDNDFEDDDDYGDGPQLVIGNRTYRLPQRQSGNPEQQARSRAELQARRDAARRLWPEVPSKQGRSLMDSGHFGAAERKSRVKRDNTLGRRLFMREMSLGSRGFEQQSPNLTKQSLVPDSKLESIVKYEDKCYSGQFSDDGTFYFSCTQDFKVRLYDTSNPFDWSHYATLSYPDPYNYWTLTDATLSADNRFMAFTAINNEVALASTDREQNGATQMLDLSNFEGRRRMYGRHFGIWSVRFSGDSRELVAGTSTHDVYVYDLETQRSILRIDGHENDVNAVCYGDKSSPHVLYSGSDDTSIKVWDRRSLGDSRPAGVFLGHNEGVTYIDSKGDGRYVLSNGKCQQMKLWDLRKMLSYDATKNVDLSRFSTGYDYRFEHYEPADFKPHPHDCSVVTFRGHSVEKTLIRCHFSPQGSTDSRYVYTGSADGSVYIYNLDATLAGKIDVNDEVQKLKGPSRTRYSAMDDFGASPWETIVRDVSWHPSVPMIAAASFDPDRRYRGSVSLFSWNDGVRGDEALALGTKDPGKKKRGTTRQYDCNMRFMGLF